MNQYEANQEFSEKKMDKIKSILRQNAIYIISIETASLDEDTKQSTDLKVNSDAGTVAVRIRRGVINFRDLTIRAKNGKSKTEIDKLRDGCAKWYLYLWTNNAGDIDDWILVDIDKMRSSGLLSESRKVTMNRDGYTGFVTYSQLELRECGALVAYG